MEEILKDLRRKFEVLKLRRMELDPRGGDTMFWEDGKYVPEYREVCDNSWLIHDTIERIEGALGKIELCKEKKLI
jgi:hypothetical protein